MVSIISYRILVYNYETISARTLYLHGPSTHWWCSSASSAFYNGNDVVLSFYWNND